MWPSRLQKQKTTLLLRQNISKILAVLTITVKKTVKPVGVKRSALSAAYLAVYEDSCDFYVPPVPV